MEYEDLIENESEPAAEKAEGEDELEAPSAAAKSPWKAFVLTGLLASLIGAIGGGAGIYAALKTAPPKPVIAQAVDLSPLEANFDRLSARVKTAESKLQDVANRPAQAFKPPDLSELETRLQALENAPRPEIDPEALTALQSAQKDGFEWPDVSILESRIEALETETNVATQADVPAELLERLTALEDNIEGLEKSSRNAAQSDGALSGLVARIDALENRPAPTPVIERISMLAFPKEKLINAVDVNREGGLIKKTLSRHIRIKDSNDPMTLIEAIETDLGDGRLASALEKFERLPEPVQSAGQAWFESVKASL